MNDSPQLDQVADLGGQAAQLVAGQVQHAQALQLPDVVGQPQQIVVVHVQRGQVAELPQRRAQVAHIAWRVKSGETIFSWFFFTFFAVSTRENEID